MSTPRIINSKLLRTAHALANTKTPETRISMSAQQIILARHTANDGKTTEEIARACGVTQFTRTTIVNFLKKHGIRPFGNVRAHRGLETTGIPEHLDLRPYSAWRSA